MKKLLKKCGSMNDEFWKGMLAICNTPLFCGKSPAQFLLCQTLRDLLPGLPNLKEEGNKSYMTRVKRKATMTDIAVSILHSIQDHTWQFNLGISCLPVKGKSLAKPLLIKLRRDKKFLPRRNTCLLVARKCNCCNNNECPLKGECYIYIYIYI